MSGIDVRPLVAADVPAYRSMMLDAYDARPDAFTATRAERADFPLTWWEARIGGPGSRQQIVFGAWRDAQLLGAVGLSFEQRPKLAHKARLFGMFVHEHARGQGVGAALVAAALGHAASRPGILLVNLTVTEGNEAAYRLYRRMGFAQFGSEPMAVQVGDGYRAKIHMWRLTPA